MATLNETYFRLLDSPANGPFPAQLRDIGDDFGNLDQPKSKYLFTMQLFPRNNMGINEGSQSMNEIKLALKTAGRLAAEVHYEDANYYSYRTKVRTKLNYNDISVTFYDDINQRSHTILTAYLMLISPIANQPATQASNLQLAHLKRATIGALSNGSQLGPLDYIRITHYIVYNGQPNQQFVIYDYLNPKIQSFSLDELDMTTSDVALVKLNFVFDTVNIHYSNFVNPTTNTNNSTSILNNTNNALVNNNSPYKSNQQNQYTLPNIGQQYGVAPQPINNGILTNGVITNNGISVT